MTPSLGPSRVVPRHPVPGPHNWQGACGAPTLHCLLDQPGTLFTTSGRAAILLGLEALALSPADRVLVPSYHCPTMVSPVLALGHQVAFYPIDADGRPSLAWLEQHAPADTRVLCVAHFFGLPLDLRPVRAWCQQRGVLLLEDCAHAMFGEAPHGAVGALGDVVIASLPKFFATQDGGLLKVARPARPLPPLTPAGAKAELKSGFDTLEISARFGRLGRWRVWAEPLLGVKQLLRSSPTTAATQPTPAGFVPEGDYARIDMALSHRQPTRATVRAALHSSRERVIAQRRQHYAAMATAFAGRAGMRPLFAALPERCAPYVFPLWVDRPDPTYQLLRESGVPVSRWDWLWPGVPDMPGDHGKSWSLHVLQLHCHQDMSDQDRDWVIGSLLSHCTG
ncbi:DegT/DnrJ/EryC1/StrS family aminotransferase [Roseateles sp.]|uniref:DegT/DnrJ/EryC1/StrS family aminotransferase n=1 Tax=Roseateles sp. TaxID=1971397 RepID=UPI003BAD4B33